MRTPCRACPLRALPAFKKLPDDKVDFVQSLKSNHLAQGAGSWIIRSASPRRYIPYSPDGRFDSRRMPDGRRQILNFMLPGDLIGLQASMFSDALYDVVALTDIETLRISAQQGLAAVPEYAGAGVRRNLARSARGKPARRQPGDGGGKERHRESGRARPGPLPARGHPRHGPEKTLLFPLSQQHIADALGLSLVHTNKTINKLRRLGMFELAHGLLTLKDSRVLARIAQAFEADIVPRPLI